MAIRDYKDTKKNAHLQLFPSKNSVFHLRHTQNSPPLKKFGKFLAYVKKIPNFAAKLCMKKIFLVVYLKYLLSLLSH